MLGEGALRHAGAAGELEHDAAAGVVVQADVTAALRDAGVSIESLIQPASAADGTALIVMLTHDSDEVAVRNALSSMAALPAA